MDIIQAYVTLALGVLMLLILNKVSIFGGSCFAPAHSVLGEHRKLVLYMSWIGVVLGAAKIVYYFFIQ